MLRAKLQGSLIPALLFALALAVRLAFIFGLGAGQRIYDSSYDQYIYLDLAKSLLAGRGFSMSYNVFVASANTPTLIEPPLYPVLLASLFRIFGESYLAVRLLHAVLGAAMSGIVYAIAQKTTGKPTGLLAALIVCVYPPLVMYTRPLMTETLYTLVLLLIMWVLVKFVVGTLRPAQYALWGAGFGLAF